MVKQIQFKKRNGETQAFTVSDDDFEWVMQWRWQMNYMGYVFRSARKSDNRASNTRIFLHRALMERIGHSLTGLVVDHHDGNPRNNTRENLRPCTHSQNSAAWHRKRRNAKSRYTGVGKSDGKWIATIRNKRLGTFASEVDAARAYNAAALTAWGEFAILNDVPVIQLELPLF